MKRIFLTVIQFLLHIHSTEQSRVRQAMSTLKVLGKTMKKPVMKTFGDTIKKSVGMFSRNKNTIKNIASGFQEKYLSPGQNVGIKAVKYLRGEGIKKFKYVAPQAVRGDKPNIQMRSAGQMSGKGIRSVIKKSGGQIMGSDLKSLINMVSKSKPQLPILFAAGGLSRLTSFNLVSNNNYKIPNQKLPPGNMNPSDQSKEISDQGDEIIDMNKAANNRHGDPVEHEDSGVHEDTQFKEDSGVHEDSGILKQANQALVFANIQEIYDDEIRHTNLTELLKDNERNSKLRIKHENLVADFAHQKLTQKILDVPFGTLVESTKLYEKIDAMFNGDKINTTYDWSVLHTALRAPKTDKLVVDGQNITQDVHDVRDKIKVFVDKVREGKLEGASRKPIKNILNVGIGGSYLGTEFVYEALRQRQDASALSKGKQLNFLANVDPVDLHKATKDLNPEETQVIVQSKTFTTTETMLNANSVKQWFNRYYKKKYGKDIYSPEDIVKSHFCAVSTNLEKTGEFGIKDDRVFPIWNWVGGRYSVTSAIGILPLSLMWGSDYVEKFLGGAHAMDKHFKNERDYTKNIPIMMGLVGFYNNSVQRFYSRAIIPYSQALSKFVSHIQQLDMESNGKSVTIGGKLTPETGPVNFGDAGTNAQHSFFQLLHQGMVVPTEFIGFAKSQRPYKLSDTDDMIPNHDELMSHFFAQPDALALGRSMKELKDMNEPEALRPHKVFSGDRPSTTLLFDEQNPYNQGQLLSIYEHRTAVEGFIWDINSYDQWGVELGKSLAKNVRGYLSDKLKGKSIDEDKFNASTQCQLDFYMENR